MRLLLFTLTAVAAWAQEQPKQTYQCPEGDEIEVTRTSAGRVSIRIAGRPALSLRAEPGASGAQFGAQFSDGYSVFSEKDGIARFESGTITLSGCKVGPPQAVESLAGNFVYFADSPSFTTCSGERAMISMRGDYLNLERAYTARGLPQQSRLYVRLQGRRLPNGEWYVAKFMAAPEGQACPEAPAGDKWTLQTLYGEAVRLTRPATLEFDRKASRVSGSNGCNRYFASLSGSGDQISFTKAGSTQMACRGDGDRIEGLFMKMLNEVTAQALTDGRLTFRNAANEAIAVFEPAPTGPAALQGKWQVTTLRGATVQTNTPPTIEFLAQPGRVAGTTGCNRYFSTAKVEGDRVTFTGTGSTRRACAAAAMELESNFLKALESITTYSRESDRLSLKDASGATLLTLGSTRAN